ncbi:MAG TPA: hypothetical protein VEC37_04150 [Bacillota bacterium]|nr:hypothetical protein [Bacillota bacterium]
MVIKLRELEVTLPNDTVSAEEVVNQIQNLLDNAQMIIKDLVINGAVVEDDHEGFIAANLLAIENIEVIGKPLQEFVFEQVEEGLAYLDRALPEVESLADEFYQGSANGTWDKFDLLLEGIQWLAQLTHAVQNPAIIANWADYQKTSVGLLQKLGELGSALQVMDQVLIADLIKYEIYPLLEELRLQFEKTLSAREYGDDTN